MSEFKLKRRLAMIITIIMFVIYYLITDPDTKIFQNLSYGAGLILTLNIFVISIGSIIVLEFIPDFIVDTIYGKEDILRKKAIETSEGAGKVMIAKSIRILAYAIITAAAIIAYNVN